MVTDLLITKLNIPPVRPDIVLRHRLIVRLNNILDCKLTLISAPAGFGKTTLLSSWVQAEDRTGECNVAWVSLSASENDLGCFLSYVVAALQTVYPEAGAHTLEMINGIAPLVVETALTGLINDLAAISEPLALVLDDYHVITARPVHEAVMFFLDHLPRNVHIVIASRADPPLPLGCLRGRGQLHELRANDLRFTVEETATLLNQELGLGIPPREVALLAARTEGWIVGLQLAAHSLQGQGKSHAARFIAALSGSNRYILDYLTEEVLNRQPGGVREFLVQTAILDRLTPSLCNAVTGRDDSATVLQMLERINLFIVPLDENRGWYRYHHLFADSLRGRLAQHEANQVALLHRRASDWYEHNGQIVEAANHALAAGDVDRATCLIEDNVLDMFHHGQSVALKNWMETLSEHSGGARPRLSVAYAWTLAYGGQLEAAESLLDNAEKTLAAQEHSVAGAERDCQHTSGYIALIRSYIRIISGQPSEGADLAQQALNYLTNADGKVRNFAANMLGFALAGKGDYAASAKLLRRVADNSKETGDVASAMDALGDLAGLSHMQGRLHETDALCQEAMRLADDHFRRTGRKLPVTGYIHLRLTQVLLERNDLQGALNHAREAVRLSKKWGCVEHRVDSNMVLAFALFELGDVDRASEAMREAHRTAEGLTGWYADNAAARAALLHLASGHNAAAAEWVDRERRKTSGKPLDSQDMARHFARVRILIALGKLDEAMSLASQVLELVQALDAKGAMIHILALQARILQAQGDIEKAIVILERALFLGRPEGYVRTFIARGAPLAKLLRRMAARGIETEYAKKLLAEMASPSAGVTHTSRTPASEYHSLIKPLTEREMDVLICLSMGFSNKEIARDLVISVGTVKNHLKRIYSKLDVHNRAHAVHRARRLSLL
jgi:LuxR family maltose regulon positive regulatory protein